VHSGVEFIKEDLAGAELDSTYKGGVDYVFHFAAYAAEWLSPFIRCYERYYSCWWIRFTTLPVESSQRSAALWCGETRLSQQDDFIDGGMTYRASVIILSYNSFETTTRECLESLLPNAHQEGFEIVVIDNASDCATRQALEAYRGNSHLKVVFNENNHGYAAGNNQGVAFARGETIVLLNSDTVVPSGAIKNMCDALQNNTQLSMVGPVTNEVGNEQAIWTRGKVVTDILSEGQEWVSHASASHIPTKQLSFFCSALTRETWDQVGELDKNFGLGYYEDTDYCIRVSQKGLEMRVLEDVFVYHQGSASFGRVPQKVKNLMRENKKKMQAKYPFSIELLHKRDANLSCLRYYLREIDQCPRDSLRSLCYRFENRLQLGGDEMPRGLFKRWAYRRRLNAIQDLWESAIRRSKIND
jgi:GT2 family glycosyltransferase